MRLGGRRRLWTSSISIDFANLVSLFPFLHFSLTLSLSTPPRDGHEEDMVGRVRMDGDGGRRRQRGKLGGCQTLTSSRSLIAYPLPPLSLLPFPTLP